MHQIPDPPSIVFCRGEEAGGASILTNVAKYMKECVQSIIGDQARVNAH